MIYVTLEHQTTGETRTQKVQINNLEEAQIYCDMMDFLGYEITNIEVKENPGESKSKKSRSNWSVLLDGFLRRILQK